MPWLACGDRVVASLEVARTRSERRRGLLGRDDLTGALLIERCRCVHTIGMSFDIDVLFLDRQRRVVDLVQMPPGRIGRPRLSARSVIETQAGACERWGLTVGDTLDVRLEA